MKTELKPAKRILLKYALLGSPIGGVFAAVIVLLFYVFLALTTPNNVFALAENLIVALAVGLLLFVCFSYLFGFIPSIICGKYVADCIKGNDSFKSSTYYLRAFSAAYVNLILFHVMNSGPGIWTIALIVGPSALFSAYILLLFFKDKLHDSTEKTLVS